MPTPHLGLPYIQSAQAQKHVTHNEALKRLDALVQISIRSRSIPEPPETPVEGDIYIPASDAGGMWAGHEGKLAILDNNVWEFISPGKGWMIWIEDEEIALIFNGTELVDLSPDMMTSMSIFGINTEADTNNRLSVKSDAVLLSHDDQTPGNGDVRVNINRRDSDATGSIIFQTDYSAAAELGLTAQAGFEVKVKSDDDLWRSAITIDRNTGAVDFPETSFTGSTIEDTSGLNLFQDGGRFAGAPEPSWNTVSSFSVPAYLIPNNGASFLEGPKFINNNSTFGGSGDALDPDMEDLISQIKVPGYIRRLGIEFYTLKCIAGPGQSYTPIIHDGANHYIVMQNIRTTLPEHRTLNMYIRVRSGSLICQRISGEILYHNGVGQSSNVVLSNADGWAQITRTASINLTNSLGYEPFLHRIYATPETEFLMATPALLPKIVNLEAGQILGLQSSGTGW